MDLRLGATTVAGALGVGAVALVFVGIPAVALLAAAIGASAPALHRRSQRARREAERRAVWPEAVELLAGSMRAGETIVGSLAVVADRGPEPLRGFFTAIAADHRVGGDLVGALGRAAHAVEDPIADRVVTTLSLIHRVGGRESARVLRTLASFLRDDLALRREVAARQSWTKVAARVAVASPWLVVLLVGLRAEGRSAYSTGTGAVVLLVGAAVSAVGYLLMARLGRVPEPPRCVVIGA
jgi:tight adherence protein B